MEFFAGRGEYPVAVTLWQAFVSFFMDLGIYQLYIKWKRQTTIYSMRLNDKHMFLFKNIGCTY